MPGLDSTSPGRREVATPASGGRGALLAIASVTAGVSSVCDTITTFH